ncbi:MAG TPA: c-type cytochrome [Polyangiaceae bacterium]|nr:c-type cytochrome [Polyangiaceae bacterium]
MWKLRILAVSALLLVVSATSCRRKAADDSSLGRQTYNERCASCHGAEGLGSKALGAPAIAGLDSWYVGAQLGKFRRGVRGSHPEDAEGARMAAAARGLESNRESAAVAEHVAQLPPTPAPAVIEGDTSRGQRWWGRCAGCHGPGAGGNPVSRAPPLNGSDDWYLRKQLGKFRQGMRGTHPDDTSGAIMRSVALTLPDDQAMNDVVAYLATLR